MRSEEKFGIASRREWLLSTLKVSPIRIVLFDPLSTPRASNVRPLELRPQLARQLTQGAVVLALVICRRRQGAASPSWDSLWHITAPTQSAT